MNGLTYEAPAFAATRHWTLEKQSVTLVLIPSPASRRTATIPASSIGILTTMLSAILASCLPSRSIPSVSTATTSADTGPSTSEQISFRTSRGSRSPACLASKDGFVVIPLIKPAWAAQLMCLGRAVMRSGEARTGRPEAADTIPAHQILRRTPQQRDLERAPQRPLVRPPKRRARRLVGADHVAVAPGLRAVARVESGPHGVQPLHP